MANAESPDPSTDLVPVANKDEEIDPLAPAPDPKLPTRKDASLKEFLSKMDDYAPIVSCLSILHAHLLIFARYQMP
jgi:transcription initiation factor TFIID subunit 10